MKTITKTIATRYAMTVGLAGALALTAVSHSFAQIRTGGEARRAQVLLSQWGMTGQRFFGVPAHRRQTAKAISSGRMDPWRFVSAPIAVRHLNAAKSHKLCLARG